MRFDLIHCGTAGSLTLIDIVRRLGPDISSDVLVSRSIGLGLLDFVLDSAFALKVACFGLTVLSASDYDTAQGNIRVAIQTSGSNATESEKIEHSPPSGLVDLPALLIRDRGVLSSLATPDLNSRARKLGGHSLVDSRFVHC